MKHQSAGLKVGNKNKLILNGKQKSYQDDHACMAACT